ncbi:Mismatch repair endonuclease pms2 [Gryganskiella cystojenkinii]|nr:Mismatch repair endonuclease pms2 [Gryganskiella cystojenkinii]
MNSIRAIDKESVHRICSGQVVLDMATAVKELLENSLDAGSTTIVVKFKQSGLEYITVTDNGCGISAPNLETLGNSFNDLALVTSFGFRGEALSSLCALATLSVTTSTGESPVGVLVEYTSEGTIQSKSPTPMNKGTIVKISNLFEGMPVRRNEFVKNIKREYTKCIGLIQAYALIVPNVRISCVSQTDKKPAVTYISTSGNASVRQNIINVFGAKAMVDVIEFDLELVKGKPKNGDNGDDDNNSGNEQDQDQGTETKDDKSTGIRLIGYISSPSFGKGRSSADRQYIYINGRPCTLPKVARVINEVYHSFNTNQSPFLVANLILPTSSYDVNVSPDKRTIFLHDERMLVEELRTKLTEFFEPSRNTFAVSEARQLIKKPDLFSRLKYGTDNNNNNNNKDKPEQEECDDEDLAENDYDEKEKTTTKQASRPGTVVQSITMSSLSTKKVSSSTSSATVANSSLRLAQTSLMDSMQQVESPVKKRKALDSSLDSESDSEQVSGEDPRVVKIINIGRRPVERDTVASARDEEMDAQDTTSVPTSIATDGEDSTLNVLEGYDPLDDRARKDEEDDVSDSDEEGQEAFDILQQQQQTQQKSKPQQRVVVLDSVVQKEGERDWIMIGFDMEEQRRKRTLRMKSLTESRQVHQEKAARRQERRQQTRLQMDRESEKNDKDESGVAVVVDEEENKENENRQSGRLRNSKEIRRNDLKLSDASFANLDDAKAQKSLSRVISKDDFSKMKVLGQFNRAFIVARLDKYSSSAESSPPSSSLSSPNDPSARNERRRRRLQRISSDIFVIDQHASDEKYNFETLQAKTVFSTQRMFQPKKLYLTAQEEITVVDHMKMLNQNGFYLDYDPQAPVSHRLQLVTLPVSERVVFDLQDFEELVFLLSQQTSTPLEDVKESDSHQHSSKMVRCSKVRALFASRACRRSVMIGHVLNHTQMKRIVRHMGEIDQPWNCPHGRPTMRHLLDLTELDAQDKQQERKQRQEQTTRRFHKGVGDDQDEFENSKGEEEEEEEEEDEGSDAYVPIAVKRPTRHQGSMFKQFLAVTPKPQSAIVSL